MIWQVRARAGAACDEASPFSEERVLGAPTTPAPPTTVATVDYRPLCAVYKDSRCANCHNDGQFPPDHGEPPPGQGCTFCHDEAIHPETDQAVWVMAPNDQRFSDPATCGDICRTVRQWALDHQGNEHDFFFHVTLDPLIAWGFEPEAILSNPVLPGVEEMTHTQYASLSTQWARDGYPCNEVTDDFPNAGDAVAAAGGGRVELPPGFDAKPPIVDPPAVKDTIWWLDPSIPKADVANLLARRGVPPECRRLIVRDRFGLSKQRLRADQLRLREADLKKICQKLMGEFGDRAR